MLVQLSEQQRKWLRREKVRVTGLAEYTTAATAFRHIDMYMLCTGMTWSVGNTCHARATQMAGLTSSQSHSLLAYSHAHLLQFSFLFRATIATSMVNIEMALVARSNASLCACETLAPRSSFLFC